MGCMDKTAVVDANVGIAAAGNTEEPRAGVSKEVKVRRRVYLIQRRPLLGTKV